MDPTCLYLEVSVQSPKHPLQVKVYVRVSAHHQAHIDINSLFAFAVIVCEQLMLLGPFYFLLQCLTLLVETPLTLHPWY